MLTLAAFIVALGLLVAVHEYGHYRMAVACGVKVLRFSVGFGRPLLRWQRKGSSTEFVVGMLPLGGYVKMLDEREAPVPPEDRHLAFNTQPLRARAAIVAAGPIANLLLAVLLYTAVNWTGMQVPSAVLASPVQGSVAQAAGLRGGERVERVALGADELEPVRSFEDLRWLLTRGALEHESVRLEILPRPGAAPREVALDLSTIDTRQADAQLFRKIGIVGPWTEPLIGEVMPGDPADRSGLREGDKVRKVGETDIVDGQQLRELIRQSVRGTEPLAQLWQIDRAGTAITLTVRPEAKQEADGSAVGRIGAVVGAIPEFVEVEYGLLESTWRGVVKTWEVSSLTLRLMGRILIGEASIKNISGPLTIADYAGRTASLGIEPYLIFLALLSVSLGVLNLLPVPVLDGGHLMYYLWEAVTGREVSELWLTRLQRAGAALLMLMMAIALFNDVTPLFGKLIAALAL